MTRRLFILFCAAALPLLPRSPHDSRILSNGNTTPAGLLRDGVLTVDLEARTGVWHPDAEDAAGLEAHAFGEVGKAAQIPGPLLRVRAGTEVHLSITNRIAGSTLRVYGLQSRPATSEERVLIEPGATKTLTLRLDAPGTYFYWGATTDSLLTRRVGMDTQLAGAIVVDGPNATDKPDRVFVITQYIDSLSLGVPNPRALVVPAINGKSWPHTERLNYEKGDTIRWRLVNGSLFQHPMHLHGFYYRIHARGDGTRDTTYARGDEPRAVTERMLPASTMLLSWTPERAGNWIFHCHIAGHVEPHKPLDKSVLPVKALGHKNHTLEGMGGLVLGVHVQGDDASGAVAAPRRELRLRAVASDTGDAQRPLYHFVLNKPDARAQRGIGQMRSPVLVLKRNEPVAITVVNELPEPTAVHWHGIELESYFDGVAGFGGTATRVSPVIEPGDSFVARFTPPRAGTFIYHTHVDELRQEPAGLSGVIVVEDEAFDPRFDHPVLLTSLVVATQPARRLDLAINNSLQPAPVEIRAGQPHRLRLVNMTLGPPRGFLVTLRRDSAVQSWRPLAKDGADLQPRGNVRPARVQIATGETYDFEVVLKEPGDYVLDARVPGGGPETPRRSLPIHVR